jgi:hypothetical protein
MQMGVSEHDYMIPELAATVYDPSLGNSILPWAWGTCMFGCYATRLQQVNNLRAKHWHHDQELYA